MRGNGVVGFKRQVREVARDDVAGRKHGSEHLALPIFCNKRKRMI